MEQWETILYLCISIFSVCGSLFLIITFFLRFKLLWDSLYQPILWMSITDLFVGITYIVVFSYPFQYPNYDMQLEDGWCGLSFVLDNYFVTSTVCWYFMVAINTFLIVRGTGRELLHKMRPYQHIFCWGYPALVTIPFLITKHYGPMTVPYCWFPDSRDPSRLFFYLLLVALLTFCLFLLCYTLYAYHKSWHVFRDQNLMVRAVLARLGIMVIVVCAVWLCAVIGRVLDFVGKKEIHHLHLVALTSSGLGNFVVWGLTSPRIFSYCICCHHKRKELTTNKSLGDPISDYDDGVFIVDDDDIPNGGPKSPTSPTSPVYYLMNNVVSNPFSYSSSIDQQPPQPQLPDRIDERPQYRVVSPLLSDSEISIIT